MSKYCCDDSWEYEDDCDNYYHGCYSKSEVDLKNSMRLLWEQHVYWTRLTITGKIFDLPNLEPTTNRLLRNAKDFGAALKPYYGLQIACEFSRLIKEHLVIAAELVTAAKNGDDKAAANAEKRWYRNADEIVEFLASINPCLSAEVLHDMWYRHLSLTKCEAVAMLNKNYTKDIAIFDKIEEEALMMADHLASGIIRQFYYRDCC